MLWECDILKRIFSLLFISLSLAGCTQLPEGVEPIEGLDIERYLGTWYEIARLDHRFEKGLEKVTANYTLRKDGGIDVINRGYTPKENRWKEAQGKAYFVNDKEVGHLKVSFFGPFYSSYVIFDLDKADYQYAFVSGFNHDYLWLLARTPTVDEGIIERFLDHSKSLGFNPEKLLFVNQDRAEPAGSRE
jgi:apolipoprotein D and lipocalin family protein